MLHDEKPTLISDSDDKNEISSIFHFASISFSPFLFVQVRLAAEALRFTEFFYLSFSIRCCLFVNANAIEDCFLEVRLATYRRAQVPTQQPVILE